MNATQAKTLRDGNSNRRGGRPTPAQALQITARIIEAAAELFFSNGFEATSIEEIVASAAISKRTFYTRFSSKAELFAAVIQHRLDIHISSLQGVSEQTGSFEETLIKIGYELSRIALTDQVISLDRLVMTEARNFPEIAHAFYDFGVVRTQNFLERIFVAARARNEIDGTDTHFLAEQFIHAIVGGPLRKAVLGIEKPRRNEELHKHVVKLVHLFVHGCLATKTKALD